MKYSKIINIHLSNRVSYLFSFLFAIFLAILFCSFNNLKAMQTSFGGVTGVIGSTYRIVYSSNWPNDSLGMDQSVVTTVTTSSYLISNNKFEVPVGYEFVEWNTLADGSGDTYLPDDFVSIGSGLFLYAQWNLIDNEDSDLDTPSNEGENGDSDTNDNNNVSSDSSSNTDNGDNNESSDDLNNENKNESSDDSGNDNNNQENLDSGNNNGSGSGTSGNGTNGGGTGSSGNQSSSNNSVTGDIGSSSNNSLNSNSNNVDDDSNKDDNIIEDDSSVVYEFKFMNGTSEYAITSCKTLKNKSCKLTFPTDNPVKEGYIFKGWSLSNLCSSKDIILDSVDVNSNNIYFACYEVNALKTDKGNKWIYLVVSVWIIASICIYCVIKKFKKNNNIVESD